MRVQKQKWLRLTKSLRCTEAAYSRRLRYRTVFRVVEIVVASHRHFILTSSSHLLRSPLATWEQSSARCTWRRAVWSTPSARYLASDARRSTSSHCTLPFCSSIFVASSDRGEGRGSLNLEARPEKEGCFAAETKTKGSLDPQKPSSQARWCIGEDVEAMASL